MTLFQVVADIALVSHGIRITDEHLAEAVTFLAGKGFLTADQYDFYADCLAQQHAFRFQVWDYPIVGLMGHKASLAAKKRPLFVSQANYALLGSLGNPDAALDPD